jgi:hypothetical protein
MSPSRSSRLQLADEETGGEEAHALGQNVLGEDVDERWQQDEGHGSLVDEEERNELGHGRLEDSLSHGISLWSPTSGTRYPTTHHLLWGNLGLLGLAGDKGRAGHGRWADSCGRAESGPREGTEEAGVHGGLSGLQVSALRGRTNSRQTACGEGRERTGQGLQRPWR